jgi:hypothetical protein
MRSVFLLFSFDSHPLAVPRVLVQSLFKQQPVIPKQEAVLSLPRSKNLGEEKEMVI